METLLLPAGTDATPSEASAVIEAAVAVAVAADATATAIERAAVASEAAAQGAAPAFMAETRLDVVTHEGTGTDTVGLVVERIGAALNIPVTFTVVKSVAQAEGVPFNRLWLLGGGDVHPSYYGEDVLHAHVTAEPSPRDRIEMVLLGRAMQADVPTFGICRGHQALAVAQGGTLWQDFEKQTRRFHPGTHRIKDVRAPLEPHLSSHTVNSYHHQAVKHLPDGFRVLARAHDGVVESVWKPGWLGVQFHPELMVQMDEMWLNLFLWFVLDGCK